MVEGEALAFVSGRDDPTTPPSLPSSLLVTPAAPEDRSSSFAADGFAPDLALTEPDPRASAAPGTTLDEPKPFSERSADAVLGVDRLGRKPEPGAVPLRRPVLVLPALGRFGAASTRA